MKDKPQSVSTGASPLRVAVLGMGSWGTVLADRAARAGHSVALWGRDRALVDALQARRIHPRLQADFLLHPRVRPQAELASCVVGAEVLFLAVPAPAVRSACQLLGEVLQPDQAVIHTVHGLEPGSELRVSEVLQAETCARQIGVLGGPTLAEEVLADRPSAAVVCSRFPQVLEDGRRALQYGALRVFAAQDVVGAEYAGALKNVLAIGAGMISELGLGENARAFLIARGVQEMTRLAVCLGAQRDTFSGLLGIGDLSVTCASALSPNFSYGAALAAGLSPEAAQQRVGNAVEGVPTSSAVQALCEHHGLTLPLFRWVHRVISEGVSPTYAMEQLLRLRTGRDIPEPWDASASNL